MLSIRSVREVRYVASQPWPFPSSLMFGCLATAEDGQQIRTGAPHASVAPLTLADLDNELEDARWFDRADILRALDSNAASFTRAEIDKVRSRQPALARRTRRLARLTLRSARGGCGREGRPIHSRRDGQRPPAAQDRHRSRSDRALGAQAAAVDAGGAHVAAASLVVSIVCLQLGYTSVQVVTVVAIN